MKLHAVTAGPYRANTVSSVGPYRANTVSSVGSYRANTVSSVTCSNRWAL